MASVSSSFSENGAAIMDYVWQNFTWTTFWRGVAAAAVILNLKSLPGVFHIRIFSAVFNHLYLNRSCRVEASRQGGHALFEPVIMSSRVSLMECDANGHKSDSTYNLDLAVSRIHLITALFKVAIDPSIAGKRGTSVGKLSVALGGVSCTFKREIKPLQAYEIWSRVLSWDDKWVYIVSHFVQKGAAKPKSFSVSGSTKASTKPCKEMDETKLIFCSSISKYVFKKGRKTVPAEEVLLALGLLPPQPTSSTANRSLHDEWNWERVQEEKMKGYEIAKQFAGLDALHETFTGSSGPALGKYGNLGEFETVLF